MINPEKVGAGIYKSPEMVRDLIENRDNKLAVMLGCFGLVAGTCLCGIVAKFGWDYLNPPQPTVTPDRRPTATRSQLNFITSTPWMQPTEIPIVNPLCITVKSGDTAGNIYAQLELNGHNPNKPVRYWRAGNANPELFTKANLPYLIQPGDIFCGAS